jgi:hypothetical protein
MIKKAAGQLSRAREHPHAVIDVCIDTASKVMSQAYW